jgi:hypothetical protein
MRAVEDTTKEPLDISVTATHESAPSRERRGLPRQSAILWTQTLTGLAVLLRVLYVDSKVVPGPWLACLRIRENIIFFLFGHAQSPQTGGIL